MKSLLPIIFAFFATSALASEAAQNLLDAGEYEAAREVALAADTVDGLNLAAEAMAAEIMLMRVDDAKDHAKDAIDLAEDALERDPDNVEATFLRALHMGFRTRSSSSFGILMNGLIGKTRDAIETFETVSPDDGRADALHGAWHLGIVRAAGDGRFGASLEEGLNRYDAAVEARPDDIVVLSNYAFSLIVMDNPTLLPRARELLNKIEAESPDNATERQTRTRMVGLLDVMDDRNALRERAKGLLNTEEVETDR